MSCSTGITISVVAKSARVLLDDTSALRSSNLSFDRRMVEGTLVARTGQIRLTWRCWDGIQSLRETAKSTASSQLIHYRAKQFKKEMFV